MGKRRKLSKRVKGEDHSYGKPRRNIIDFGTRQQGATVTNIEKCGSGFGIR